MPLRHSHNDAFPSIHYTYEDFCYDSRINIVNSYNAALAFPAATIDI
jgi:hypothetical protein